MKLNTVRIDFFYIKHATRKHFSVPFNFYTVSGLEKQVQKFLKENPTFQQTHKSLFVTWSSAAISNLPLRRKLC